MLKKATITAVVVCVTVISD